MNDVPSPCVKICRLDERRTRCIGCGRTLDEIAAWPALDDEGRRRIMERLLERRPAADAATTATRP